MTAFPRLVRAALMLCATACASSGFSLVTLMPGVINDPANLTLRRQLMSFGTTQFCKELMQRSAPLRLADDQNVIGRFYPTSCDYKELDGGDAFVQIAGSGYGYTQTTGRMGFTAAGAIQYNQDFLIDGSTMYAYFRPRNIQSTNFQSQMVERVDQGGIVGAVLGGTAKQLADRVGSQLVSQELQRGFTVLRRDNGETDFGLGIVEKGQQPFHPFAIHGSSKITLANERTEVHTEQRDFLGPFQIDDDGRALWLTMSLDGAKAVDVLVLPRETADPWLGDYMHRAGVTPLTQSVLMGDVLPAGQQWARTVPLKKGSYYVVLDNTSSCGPTAPQAAPVGPLGAGDLPAVVSYVIQLGDAP